VLTAGAGPAVAVALLATSSYQGGLILEKRALNQLPAIDARHAVTLLRTVLSSPAWLAGFAFMLCGLALQVAALTRAPVTVVQPVLACGVVILLVASRLVLGERLGRTELACVLVMAISIVMIALSAAGPAGRAGYHVNGLSMALVAAPSCTLGLLLGAVSLRQVIGRHRAPAIGVSFGLATGLLYGVSTLAAKALSAAVISHHIGMALLVAAVASPYPYMVLGCSGAAMLLFQTALQRCRVSIVGPVSNITGSAYFMIAGTWLFGERLPADPGRLALRLTGIAVAGVVVVVLSRRSPAEAAVARAEGGTAQAARAV